MSLISANTIFINKQAEKTLTEAVLKKVNEEQKYNPTRAFAVVQVCGKQFKVTTGDVIIIEGYWPPDVGDKLRLDKVLCAGGVNFSVFGTPLVQHGLVDVQATVIEKTLSHTKTHFRKKRRKQYMNINFYRTPRTMLRINDVRIGQLKETVDEY
ncbi:mitochondrial ribosomal protein L21 [Carabus blaptoides fortunei]